MVKCPKCSSTSVRERNLPPRCTSPSFQCNECRTRFAIKPSIIHSPEFLNSEFVLREMTFEKEGHYPELLHRQSNEKRIWVKCGTCLNIRSVNRYRYKKLGQECKRCATVRANKEMRGKGRGRPRGRCATKDKTTRLGRIATTLASNISTRIRNSRIQDKPGRGSMRYLGYSADELRSHVRNELSFGCCICGGSIVDSKWHLSHLIPSSYASTFDELVQLYQLENLSTAHALCNIKLGDRMLITQD
jgi:5-methylcytosine-specific restriction endonuclease McrA